LAAMNIKTKELNDYVTSKLNTNDWSFFDSNITCLPDKVIEKMSNSFFAGMSAAQYVLTLDGGIFVNPVLQGLLSDVEVWSAFLATQDSFELELMYLDIPFELYDSVVDEKWRVEKDVYEASSELIQSIVDALHKVRNESRVLH
jgi:hypothetical protein